MKMFKKAMERTRVDGTNERTNVDGWMEEQASGAGE